MSDLFKEVVAAIVSFWQSFVETMKEVNWTGKMSPMIVNEYSCSYNGYTFYIKRTNFFRSTFMSGVNIEKPAKHIIEHRLHLSVECLEVVRQLMQDKAITQEFDKRVAIVAYSCGGGCTYWIYDYPAGWIVIENKTEIQSINDADYVAIISTNPVQENVQ